jgi:CheY-like chemotaxis protein
VRLICEREGDSVHIRVVDQGRGIPGDKIEKIFERFHQVDASDAREKGGSGLGLAISRGIVEQHEGKIWAESELNNGATFHVVLPLLSAARPRSESAAAATPQAAAPLVLICEDDADVRMVLKAMLGKQGYRVIDAADGETAIALAAEQRPAVILLDLIMPEGLDGWATMARLKADSRTCDIPIIIVSGATEGDVQQELVRKPVDQGELVHAIEHALARWGAGANVLVVEDDEDLARILVEFLHSHGLHTLHARDGHEAVRMSQQISPSLIILDLMLPDRDGLAVVDWLRQHDRLRDVPIMVYTARDLDDEQRARLGVAPEFLFTKSRMAPEDLVERVAALVGRITWNQDNA